MSLETALSFYGILDQFPYTVTSITTKKTREVKCRGKVFSYSQIKKDYFNGFKKQDNFLIAHPEKAVFDFAYFAYNGLRSKETLRGILEDRLAGEQQEYLRKNAQGKFLKFIQQYA